jgi:carbon storage regulator CsrA
MLILTRALDETIFIGPCRVTVLGVVRRKQGRIRVRLGIDAPRDIPIRRAELSPRPSEQQSGPAMHSQRHAHGDLSNWRSSPAHERNADVTGFFPRNNRTSE